VIDIDIDIRFSGRVNRVDSYGIITAGFVSRFCS